MEVHVHHERDGVVGGFQRPLLIALWITAVVMIAEFVGGLLANSLALLSDAAHMLTDILALLLSIVAFRLSSRPPTNKTTFGFYRLEIFAAQINGGILVFLSLFIAYEAYLRLIHPEPVKSVLMMIIAAVGLVANMASVFVLQQSSKKNLNVKATFLHIVGDLLSSVGVIIGGIIIFFTNWFIVDPILSIMIGLVILKGAYGVVKETAAVLLEAVPQHINLGQLIQEVQAIKGVHSFHDVHVWTITSGFVSLSAHLKIAKGWEIQTVIRSADEIVSSEFGILHTTFQPEMADEQGCETHSCPESGAGRP
jgi:cobalt-zinc-cadmium efflux system protein